MNISLISLINYNVTWIYFINSTTVKTAALFGLEQCQNCCLKAVNWIAYFLYRTLKLMSQNLTNQWQLLLQQNRMRRISSALHMTDVRCCLLYCYVHVIKYCYPHICFVEMQVNQFMWIDNSVLYLMWIAIWLNVAAK